MIKADIMLVKLCFGVYMYKDRESQDIIRKPKQICTTIAFDDMESLLLAVKRLNTVGYNGTNSLYYDEARGWYYINLEDVSIKDIKFVFLEEYSRCIRANNSCFVKEHYRCICKREAIKRLSLCSL